MKKILTFAFALLLMFSLISCKKETPDQGGNEQNQQTQQTQENVEDTGFKVETSQKVYLTTIGQSDFDTVANLIDKTSRKTTTIKTLYRNCKMG